MSDRELLELAAKAAGIDGEWDESHKSLVIGVPFRGVASMMNYEPWNPLTDDGDALRLAVKLKLSVCFEERNNHDWTHIVWVCPVFEPCVGDISVATRRAIVRAAAEIGRKL